MKNSDLDSNNSLKKAGILAQKIVSGCDDSCEEFVKDNYRWLLYVVRQQFSKSNVHEDIVQDAFLIVLSNLKQGKVNDYNCVIAYLRQTAINIGLEYLRKDKVLNSKIDQSLLDIIEDNKSDVYSNIERSDQLNYVRKIIGELSIQRDRDILINYYFDEKNKPTICKDLNLSSTHFDRVFYRARERLKELIEYKENGGSNHKKRKLRIIKLNSLISLCSMMFLSFKKVKS